MIDARSLPEREAIENRVLIRVLSSRLCPSPLPLGAHPLVTTASVEEARALYSRSSTPVRLELADPRAPFGWRCNLVTIGSLALSAHAFEGGLQAWAEDVEGFSISFPLGASSAEADDGATVAPIVCDRTSRIDSPGQKVRFRLETGYRALQLFVRPLDLEAAFAALTGAERRAGLRFEPRIALDTGAGASLQRLVRLAADEADNAHGMLSSPLVTARFVDMVLFGLLHGQRHNQSARLLEAARPAEPRYVQLAAEYLAANAAEPVRLSALAALVGVSVRVLQAGFLAHRGCSPMQFLRDRRFVLARARLLDAPSATVTQVALDCGFGHLGRFSAQYRQRFGETPSETRARSRRDR